MVDSPIPAGCLEFRTRYTLGVTGEAPRQIATWPAPPAVKVGNPWEEQLGGNMVRLHNCWCSSTWQISIVENLVVEVSTN